jgi:hypothetical protein
MVLLRFVAVFSPAIREVAAGLDPRHTVGTADGWVYIITNRPNGARKIRLILVSNPNREDFYDCIA